MSATKKPVIAVLGTGGTIAGQAADARDNVGYVAGARPVSGLLPAMTDAWQAAWDVRAEDLARLDSKDMSHEVWCQLARKVAELLDDPAVHGLVITHGTDTLEETAFFLHLVLHARKPVVLTCAMRPATSLSPDGPQNLLDAFALVTQAGAQGVMAICAGRVHAARDIQKVHPYRLDPFDSGDEGVIGYVEEGQMRRVKPWPYGALGAPDAPDSHVRLPDAGLWPVVEIVTSHAGASPGLLNALLREPPAGLIVACTGNATVHEALLEPLSRAQSLGVRVLRATRCAQGAVVEPDLGVPHGGLPVARGLSPVKARVALMVALMTGQAPC